MTEWIVTRYKFKENDRQYHYDGIMNFNTDKALLDFIKNVMSVAGDDFRWSISYIVKEFKVGDNQR